ncbi:class I SAM-dependent methyltransferase [Rhizobium sp. KVB221]|uniref:Class I SAM-dependent methyltransferase n=1 Tax=Rhizobium setariae TaxID=2801340 RepID=A0A936YI28_9HYPH|nr:class I SAM-dependent methyltransferase [Rhizobium setariae]MBL0370483.1 class I SAM-dependent methyltransferase [Rhizobium setariae]
MSRDAVKTLFHPFATRTLTPPAQGERVLFLGAEAGFDLPEDFGAAITAVQPFRPLYNGLMRRGIEAQPFTEGEDYDMALVLLNRHRGANENYLADALKRVRPGARIVVAGSKEDGVQSLRKRVGGLGLETEHLAKYHAQAFWFARPVDSETITKALVQPQAFVLDRFVTAPGMFSHGEADPGSVFLARYFPKDYKKLVADFGAGWGFLASEFYSASPNVEGIDLYEADHPSLEAARRNLNTLAPKLSARYFWHDLAREEVKHRYDLIIMNPPFHEGHATEPSLGQAMIKMAASALKSGGELLMVANRGLPYEPVLKELFRTSGEVARNARYKVLSGKK